MSSPRRFSITTLLIGGFGTLMVAAVGAVLLIGFDTARRNTQALWVTQASLQIESLEASLADVLLPVTRQSEWIQDHFESGKLSFSDEHSLDQFMQGALGAAAQIGGIGVVDTVGMSRRWARSNPEPEAEDWSQRQPIMDWLQSGKGRQSGTWLAPFWTPTIDQTVLLYDSPLVYENEFRGMLAIIVPLSGLSRVLAREHATQGLVPFVLYGPDRVLAHPLVVSHRGPQTENAQALPTLETLGDPILAKIWRPDIANPFALSGLSGARSSIVDHADRNYLFIYKSLRRYGLQEWTIGVYMDADAAGGLELARLRAALAISIAVLVCGVLLAVWLGLRLGKRIRNLATIAQAVVGETSYSEPPSVPTSRLRELDDAARAMTKMFEVLREREVIRNTLGRYVPTQIAGSLLDEGGDLPATETTATVLFCDLEAFSRLTEKVGPTAIVGILNEYFSAMVGILEQHSGVVTQFQGDAILATFNVPVANDEHACDAVRAALQMLEAVQTQQFHGQQLALRIGIDTGPVLAGAVGASGRLSYTVHGDAVNMASRLEQLNKQFTTRILISERTAKACPDVDLREVANVEIRGHTHPITVYEPIQESRNERARACGS